MNPAEIESVLRRAPRPSAPPELKQRLAALELPRVSATPAAALPHASTPLWRRWIPALSFGLLLLGCFIVLGIQTVTFLNLRRENAALRAATAELHRLRQENADRGQPGRLGPGAELTRQHQEELASLRAEVARLREQTAELAPLQAEHQRLQAERAAAASQANAPLVEDPFAAAQKRAQRIACISNIKQIGLAARMWSNDHNTDILPLDFRLMNKELVTPKILTCPGDTARTPVSDWNAFDGSSVSYVLMSKKPSEASPQTVYTRCPIHNNVGLTDGSAHQLSSDFTFRDVDGQVTFERVARPTP